MAQGRYAISVKKGQLLISGETQQQVAEGATAYLTTGQKFTVATGSQVLLIDGKIVTLLNAGDSVDIGTQGIVTTRATDAINQNSEAVEPDADVAAIQQALQAGTDVTETAPAPAAGNASEQQSAGGDGGATGGGALGATYHIDYSGQQTRVTAGYETSEQISPQPTNLNLGTVGNNAPSDTENNIIDNSAPLAPTVTIVDDQDNDGQLSQEEIGSDNIQVTVQVNAADLAAGGTVNLTINNGGTISTVELTLKTDGTGTLQSSDGKSYSYDAASGTISWTENRPADSEQLTVEATQTDNAGNTSAQGSDTASVLNEAPNTQDHCAEGLEDAISIAIPTLSGTDSDGAVVSFTINTLPTNGVLYLGDVAVTEGQKILAENASQLTFKPNADWNGSTNFTYVAVDNNGLEDATAATVTIRVNPVDDAPTVSVDQHAAVSEEGLVGGIADNTGNSDSTNAVVTKGQITVNDIDSDKLDVSLDGPDGLTSGGNSISWQWNADTHELVGYTGTLNGNDYNVIIEVGLVSPNESGKGDWSYELTLMNPLDHPVTGGEDSLVIQFDVSVSDGKTTTDSKLNITFEDDAPIAKDIFHMTESETKQGANVQLILDVSGSMNKAVGNDNSKSRLDLMKESAIQLIEQYQALGQTQVQLILFSDKASIKDTDSDSLWMTVAEAKSFINALGADGGTDYDHAIKLAQDCWSGNDKGQPLSGATNVSYFLSDGVPEGSDWFLSDWNIFNNPNTIEGDELSNWINHLKDNDVTSLAYGMGNDVPKNELDKVAYDGYSDLDTNAVVVPDVTKLPAILLQSIIQPVGGNLLNSADGYGIGADGGVISEISINGVKYLFDGHSISVSGKSTSLTYDFDDLTKTLSIYIDNKHSLVIDLDDGSYKFYGAVVSPSVKLDFGYTLKDNDGDVSSSTMTFVVGSDINSSGEQIDSVQVYDPDLTNQKVQWSSTGGSDGSIKYYENAEKGLVVDVGAGGDNVHLGKGDDIIFLGNSHVEGLDSKDHAVAKANAERAWEIFGSGKDSDWLQESNNENSALNITSFSNAFVDIAHGGEGNDRIYGQGGVDLIFGGAGNDYLDGGADNDVLRGGSGNDILLGGAGNDILIGGAGKDLFVWTENDQEQGQISKDIVQDFSITDNDCLDLSQLLQNEKSSNIGDFISFERQDDSLILKLSVTANGEVSQHIELQNQAQLMGQHAQGQYSSAEETQLLDDLIRQGALKIDL